MSTIIWTCKRRDFSLFHASCKYLVEAQVKSGSFLALYSSSSRLLCLKKVLKLASGIVNSNSPNSLTKWPEFSNHLLFLLQRDRRSCGQFFVSPWIVREGFRHRKKSHSDCKTTTSHSILWAVGPPTAGHGATLRRVSWPSVELLCTPRPLMGHLTLPWL